MFVARSDAPDTLRVSGGPPEAEPERLSKFSDLRYGAAVRIARSLRELRIDRWGPLAALIVGVSAAYALTLLPGLHHFGDTTKAQFLGRLLGMTHPTGYPLYILLTAPFSWLPVGTLAQRINAFSALLGVLTVVGVYGMQRQLGVRPVFAALAAAMIGLSRTLWSQAVIAEVYTLNSALMTATFYCLLRWSGKASQVRWFVAACAVYSLSFGNHLTVLMFLPAFALATFTGEVRALLRPRVVLSVLGCICFGVALYGYLFTRTQANTLYLEYRVSSFDEFVAYVTGGDYKDKMLAFSVKQVLRERLPRFATQAFRDLGPLVFLAPLGAFLVRDRRSAAVLGLAGLVSLIWVATYDIPDIQIYLIPVEVILAVFIGVGLDCCAGSRTSSDYAAVPSSESTAPLRSASSKALPRGWRVARLGLVCAAGTLAVVSLASGNAPNHEKSARFEREVDRQIALLGANAVLLSPIYYNPRMAFVHRFYAQGLSDDRNLHLAEGADLARVARYLGGEPTLRDAHTRRQLPLGLRVYVSRRAYRGDWTRQGLALTPARYDLREVVRRDEGAPRSTEIEVTRRESDNDVAEDGAHH